MNEDQYLSVKEFARAAGVSVQAVYKRLSKDLKPFVNEVDGRKAIDKRALKEVYGKDQEDQEEKVDNDLINVLMDQINLLTSELNQKNSEINELHRLLENEQKLRLVDKSVSEPEEVEPDQERKADQEQQPEPEPKKSWWLRFFQ